MAEAIPVSGDTYLLVVCFLKRAQLWQEKAKSRLLQVLFQRWHSDSGGS